MRIFNPTEVQLELVFKGNQVSVAPGYTDLTPDEGKFVLEIYGFCYAVEDSTEKAKAIVAKEEEPVAEVPVVEELPVVVPKESKPKGRTKNK